MTKDEMLAYSEVDEILNLLEDEYKDKVPQKIKELFKEEKNKEYKPKINIEIPLNEQNLKRETIVLLAILNLNCWCKDENEKQQILKELFENEEKSAESYDIDNLFYKIEEEKNQQIKNDMKIIEYKEENFFKKIINKIIKRLKRDKRE